jgi:hypothetical protein
MALVAEGEIIHRALTPGHRLERAIERIGHTLRSFHIACDHRRRRLGVQHATLRHDYVQRAQAPAIQWNVVVHEGSEYVQDGGRRDRARRVEIIG